MHCCLELVSLAPAKAPLFSPRLSCCWSYPRSAALSTAIRWSISVLGCIDINGLCRRLVFLGARKRSEEVSQRNAEWCMLG